MDDLQSRLAAALAGRYTVEREIGRGGMSIVYLARDLRHGRRVALKALRPELAGALGPERFLLEIRVAAGLTHPHILPLFDSGIADGLLFYTMPYVEGESLRHRLQREGRLSLAEAVRITREVADALGYAHGQNIVHRDIKPENILLEAGHPVVSDFGIARAISEADESRMTGAGIVVGTVDYMSPEQASGDDLDGRSDIFALGCVLYEMLIGRTPLAARTSTGTRPTLTEVRGGIPLEVQLAVETALARERSERYASAGEFAAALQQAEAALSPARDLRGRQRTMQRSFWIGVAATTAGVLAMTVVPRYLRANLDPSLYVVVPFGHREGAAPKLITGDRCESLMLSAFSRWDDVRLVDDLRVRDVRSRLGFDSVTIEGAFDLARELGSGQLVWGDVAQFGDTIEVRAALYDVRRETARRRHAVRFRSNAADIDIRFRELADSLLLGHVRSEDAGPVGGGGAVLGTRLLGAWQAYADGQSFLSQWDLQNAEDAFRLALESDPNYAHAQLWLAQTLVWAGRPAAEWSAHAITSASSAPRLGIREQSLARALAHLANEEFFQACAEYRQLVMRDSLDFGGWYGLGDCQTRDRVVVRDSTSPSGWRFRSSYTVAAEAFQRALGLIPSVHRAFTGVAFTRLTKLFFAEPGVFRQGHAAGQDTAWFGAWPGLDHDTLVFTPFPMADFFAARPGTIPTTAAAALTRNRERMRQITLRWLRAFPNSAEAHEGLARVLETTGELEDRGLPETSALASVRRARQLSTDSIQRLRLVVAEVRLLVKLGDFVGARVRADSALGRWNTVGPADAAEMAGMAALTGHVDMTAELLRRSAPVDTPVTGEGVPMIVPRPAAEQARALVAYAAFGTPRESLVTARARSEQRIETWVEEPRKAQARDALLYFPSILAFPELGLTPLHKRSGEDDLLDLQWAFAHGETQRMRAGLTRLDSLRKYIRPGDWAVFVVYHESWLLLAAGDTNAALRRMDPFLDALQTLGLHVLKEAAESALLVRLMALRADIAARRGDREIARRWAHAVAALWEEADPVVQPTVQRMRALAATKGSD